MLVETVTLVDQNGIPVDPGTGIDPPAGDIGGTLTVPTVVSTHLSSALPVAQGGTNATTPAAALTSLGAAPAASPSFTGVASFGGGTKTTGSAPAITPAFSNGSAAQLADTTRDYTVYLQISTAGTGFSVLIGPTSSPANTVYTSATPVGGELITIRLPAGWYLEWAGTTTMLANQLAVGC